MIEQPTLIEQLRAAGLRIHFFVRPEIQELSQIINPGEQIRHAIFGFYQGGSALLVATDNRLLLIDKRSFFVHLEDIRYEMINDVHFAANLLSASLRLTTGSKELYFKSISDAQLRRLCNFTQDQITLMRQPEQELQAVWQPHSNLLARQRPRKFTLTPTQFPPTHPLPK